MESSSPKRRFPPPWRVEPAGADCYEFRDANGFKLASVHCRDDLQKWSFGHNHLTSDEARHIAAAIARLLEIGRRAELEQGHHQYRMIISSSSRPCASS